MKKQQVRPRVDKELFEEVIDYCGCFDTFCDSLKWLIKSSKRNKSLVDRGGKVIHEQNETIDKLKARICDLESRLDRAIDIANETVDDYEREVNELFKSNKSMLIWRLVAAISIGINVGLALRIFS